MSTYIKWIDNYSDKDADSGRSSQELALGWEGVSGWVVSC